MYELFSGYAELSKLRSDTPTTSGAKSRIASVTSERLSSAKHRSIASTS